MNVCWTYGHIQIITMIKEVKIKYLVLVIADIKELAYALY